MVIFSSDLNSQLPVWLALKHHIDYIAEFCPKIEIILSEKIDQSLYGGYEIITYNNFFHLIGLLRKSKSDRIFCYSVIHAFFLGILLPFHKKKVITWVQGAIGEESYMRNNSTLRKKILSLIEVFAFVFSYKIIFVSRGMAEYYKKKYGKICRKKYLIIPCGSRLKKINCKKIENSFCYIGGMSPWQKVDWAIEFYKQYFSVNNNSSFHIATFEHDKIYSIIRDLPEDVRKSIHLYKLSSDDEVSEFLSSKMYGFLLRENHIVNNVSSPIKLAEYLSCGVNVIISESVESYANCIQDIGAGLKIPNGAHGPDLKNLVGNLQYNEESALQFYALNFSKKYVFLKYKALVID